jgi:anti-sigma B factor antagonist
VTAGDAGEIAVVDGPEVVTLQLSGEFDLGNVRDVERVADDLITAGARNMCLDVHAVTFMDSTMLNLMVNLRKRLVAHGGELSIQPNVHIKKLLEITGLGDLFDLAGD